MTEQKQEPAKRAEDKKQKIVVNAFGEKIVVNEIGWSWGLISFYLSLVAAVMVASLFLINLGIISIVFVCLFPFISLISITSGFISIFKKKQYLILSCTGVLTSTLSLLIFIYPDIVLDLIY